MPMPWAYRHASKDWQAFLDDARDRMQLTSENSTYTAVEAVLKTFRARLSVAQALAFADLLPAVLRAIFVSGWRPADPLPFADRATLTSEVKALRRDHNLTPDNAIEAVAFALRRQVHQGDLDALLATLPPAAADYLHSDADPAALRRRIV